MFILYIFVLFCQVTQNCISSNVLGWRRFASPNEGFAKQRPGLAKCGGAKYHKGACDDWDFTEPEPP